MNCSETFSSIKKKKKKCFVRKNTFQKYYLLHEMSKIQTEKAKLKQIQECTTLWAKGKSPTCKSNAGNQTPQEEACVSLWKVCHHKHFWIQPGFTCKWIDLTCLVSTRVSLTSTAALRKWKKNCFQGSTESKQSVKNGNLFLFGSVLRWK